jgi:ABC-2 type transport system ATP-binding protein
MINPILIIEKLTKTFATMDRPALDLISTEIMPGKMIGLVGPDGAGKTTLIRLLVGLLHPDSGKINVSNFDTVTQADEIHKISGYMPQRFGLYEDLTVIENLNLFADLRQVNKDERDKKFRLLLDFTNLKNFQTTLSGKLSGGMKQKLGLACALIGNPKILFLDEPSVGVDPISRRELLKMVKNLLSQDIAVIWSTSYLDEAEQFDSVILLNDGKKLYDGPPNDLLKNIEKRVFLIQNIEEKRRRKILIDLLQNHSVIDGIIQGHDLRVLIAKNQEKPKIKEGIYTEIKPRFEDAFIDILGGITCRHSLLSDEIEAKPVFDLAVVSAQNLMKKFGNFTAVKNNSFEIKRGEIFGLLGPNGAGKSTTFKMMCGLVKPTSGKAMVKGFDLSSAPSEARSRIGYMAQKFSLYGNLNILQNLQFFSGLYGLSGQKQKHQIDLMVNIFDFKNHLKINAGSLPLGFKQRLALACSVMHQPDVLFLDEPTSGVDPLTRREFWTHINGMVEKGVTIMVTTHFMDEAEYCDRVALIYKGENIATGTPDHIKQIIASPKLENPTLEDAFIAHIENYDLQHK